MTSLSLSPPLSRPRPARRAAFGQIVLNEARLAWRQPVSLLGGLVFPLLLLVVFHAIPAFRSPAADLGGDTRFAVYVPILIVFTLGIVALMGLPISLASYRELGVLRRLSTTPVPPSCLLAAQGIVQLGTAVAGLAVVLTVAVTAFGAPVPKSPGALALSVLLTVAGLAPIGLLLGAAARTAGSASVIGRLIFFPMMFFAGLWWPRELMPGALQVVSSATPLGAAVQAMQDSMQGQFPPAAPLLVLAAYAVVFGFLAKRFFRWQ
jgi:ABC-2 type transport system permease protein